MAADTHLKDEDRVAARQLLRLAGPYLRRRDHDGLAARLSEGWSPECLTLLLESDESDVVETALICLGLFSDTTVAPAIARCLHHVDQLVASAAENALWSIWFRAGGPMAQAALARIARSIKAGETENVVSMLTELIRAYPNYAEAHHQRSQAYYLQGAYDFALRDARRAVALNPLHFGAQANEAHALAALGRSREALDAYRAAFRLHPTMPGIREAIDHLRERFFATTV
jgi:tetratricopeptide (TPR) repeat protein